MKTDIELKAEAFDEFIAKTVDGDFRDRLSSLRLSQMFDLKKAAAEFYEPHRIAMKAITEGIKQSTPRGK